MHNTILLHVTLHSSNVIIQYIFQSYTHIYEIYVENMGITVDHMMSQPPPGGTERLKSHIFMIWSEVVLIAQSAGKAMWWHGLFR